MVIILDYQNTQIFLQKVAFQIRLKKFLWLKKIRTLWHEHVILAILTEKKLTKKILQKKIKKTNQKEFRVEKVINRKCDKPYVKWKE